MAARTRALLHASKADDFAAWLCAKYGWTREATKGVYEALRLRDPSGAVHVLCKRDRSAHLTIGWDAAKVIEPLVHVWIRERRREERCSE